MMFVLVTQNYGTTLITIYQVGNAVRILPTSYLWSVLGASENTAKYFNEHGKSVTLVSTAQLRASEWQKTTTIDYCSWIMGLLKHKLTNINSK